MYNNMNDLVEVCVKNMADVKHPPKNVGVFLH